MVLTSPPQNRIWPGAILGSIAHAIFVCRSPELAHEQSWDGNNYNVQDSAGSRGTIAFDEQHKSFVAVFFYEPSERNPFQGGQPYNIEKFLQSLPTGLVELASKEALQYVLQEYDGTAIPIVTSAFWGDTAANSLRSMETWEQVYENGGLLIANQLLEPDVALRKWGSDFDFDPSELSLVESLWLKKMSRPDQVIRLSNDQWQQLTSLAAGEEGIEASRESLREIGILL